MAIKVVPKEWTPKSDGFKDIGRIPKLRPEIDQANTDPNGNISKQLKDRMSVIDLIPCMFENPMSSLLDLKSPTGYKPVIKFEEPIKTFQRKLNEYGLTDGTNDVSFLRVYLTDMSNVQDEISNTYSTNVLDDTLNSITSSRIGKMFQTIEKTSQSMGTGQRDNTGILKKLAGLIPATKEIPSGVLDGLENVITHGARISFPKIWSDNSYSPNLTCNIKLISPYGHPDAISEFIIKPLGFLLVLLSPVTQYGLVTQRPQYLTMKSYGMSNLTLCAPSSISIRRGGDDSSFNMYKQPMSVEIALQFDTTSQGFAVFDTMNEDGVAKPEAGIFSDGTTTKSFEKEFTTEPPALFSTLGTLVNSFRPFGYKPPDTTSSTPGAATAGGNPPLDDVPDLDVDV